MKIRTVDNLLEDVSETGIPDEVTAFGFNLRECRQEIRES
jgi:hypothetical protein